MNPPTISISPRVRFALYLAGTLGSALVAYAVTKGWIGDAEVALWAVVAGVLTTLAAANVGQPEQGVRDVQVHVNGRDISEEIRRRPQGGVHRA